MSLNVHCNPSEQLSAVCTYYTGTPLSQDDEIAALRAIYDEDFQQAEGAETSFSILVRSEGATLSLDLSVSTSTLRVREECGFEVCLNINFHQML